MVQREVWSVTSAADAAGRGKSDEDGLDTFDVKHTAVWNMLTANAVKKKKDKYSNNQDCQIKIVLQRMCNLYM